MSNGLAQRTWCVGATPKLRNLEVMLFALFVPHIFPIQQGVRFSFKTTLQKNCCSRKVGFFGLKNLRSFTAESWVLKGSMLGFPTIK